MYVSLTALLILILAFATVRNMIATLPGINAVPIVASELGGQAFCKYTKKRGEFNI